MKESFWAKVLFREYTSHYITMTPEERARDVQDSIVALTRLDADGDSFGNKMVRWATERMESKQTVANRDNGRLGGRPPTRSIPPPRDKHEVYEFAQAAKIWDDFAYEWYVRNYQERNGTDKAGNRIENWKGALINDWKNNRDNYQRRMNNEG